MKRILTLTLAILTLVMSLTACGNQPAATAKTPEELTEAYKTAIQSSRDAELDINAPILTAPDDDFAELILPSMGITEETATAYAAAVSVMGIQAYAVVLVMPAEGKADEVTASLNAYVDAQKLTFERYLEDQYQIAKAATVETLSDGTVMLVMCEDGATVAQSIKESLAA